MAIWYNSNCSTLGVGCYLYEGPGLTNPAPVGYYSDGTYCYFIGGGGYISSMSACATNVYINGDIYPNYADGGGVFYGVIFSSTTLYAGGAIAVNTNVSLPIYAYDDLSNYGTSTATIYNGQTCGYFNIYGFSPGAYISDWGPTNNPSPSSSGTQNYSTGYYTIASPTPC